MIGNSTSREAGRGRPRWAMLLGLLVVVFGVATIISGGSVLFGPDSARDAAGRYLPAIVWFNFVSGFFYIAGGVGLIGWKRWAGQFATLLAAAILVATALFAVHVVTGGAYEARTAAAMLFRSFLWLSIAILACHALPCRGTQANVH